jgi:hypothetical protein
MYFIKRSLSVAISVIFINCITGPAGPRGEDGKNVEIKDSVYICSGNKLKLSANKQWISTNININIGERLLIKSSGKINISNEEFDPNGGSAIGSLSYPLSNKNVNALFFIIGESDIIKTGKSYYGFASDSGEIKFIINTMNEIPDSNGYFTIDSLVTYSE